MSQVTRCPSCGTRFKVVADQLRISQGWVRCGVCQDVFDATQSLLETVPGGLDDAAAQSAGGMAAVVEQPSPETTEAVKSVTVGSEVQTDAASADQHSAEAMPDADVLQQAVEDLSSPVASSEDGANNVSADAAGTSISTAPVVALAQAGEGAAGPLQEDTALAEERYAPSLSTSMQPEDVVKQTDGGDLAVSERVGANGADVDAVLDGAQLSDLALGAQPVEEAILAFDAELANAVVELAPVQAHESTLVTAEKISAEPEDLTEAAVAAIDGPATGSAGLEPGFVRDAKRKAFWRRPLVRSIVALSCVLAAAALAAQYAWYHKNELAAEYQALAPALHSMCDVAGCTLQARQAVSDLVIASSGFKRLSELQQGYQLSLSLENKSSTPVAMPAVELTLHDDQDKPLLRKVILLRELGAPAQLPGNGEWSVAVPVRVQGLSTPVAGYRALVFYP